MELTIKPDIREQTLAHGVSYPTDEELLMLILGRGSKGLPVGKLAKQVSAVLRRTERKNVVLELCKIKGMGTSRALMIAAAIDLGRRQNCHLKARIHTPGDALPFLKQYSIEQKEHFIAITLNGAHEIIKLRVVSIGTVNKTIIHPREIFCDALSEHAAAIIICHNHPSGTCAPSPDDIQTTRTLLQASKILGITLLDHIIISQTEYFSFLEHNLLFGEKASDTIDSDE